MSYVGPRRQRYSPNDPHTPANKPKRRVVI